MSNPNLISHICQKDNLGNYLNSHLRTSEIFWLCNQVLGIQGGNITHKLPNLPSNSIHPSTHNQRLRTFIYHRPSKNNDTRQSGSSELSPPVLGKSHDTICHQAKYWSISNILRPEIPRTLNNNDVSTIPWRSIPRNKVYSDGRHQVQNSVTSAS